MFYNPVIPTSGNRTNVIMGGGRLALRADPKSSQQVCNKNEKKNPRQNKSRHLFFV
jgi:hypothetical protein